MFRTFGLLTDFVVSSELMLFSERLAQARKKRKVSQEELASRLGVHAPIIGRYERGEVKPSVEVAARIAKALGFSLDFLTGLTDRELDSEVIGLMDDLQGLEKDEQTHIIKTLQSLIRDARARAAYG